MLTCQTAEKTQASQEKITESYHRWFEIIPANTPALREKAYRLRYQVYCCENQYENPEEHPQRMERDAFDPRSIHSLLIHRATGIAIGTVRLILPDPESRKVSLPIQQVCHHPLLKTLPMSSVAEISRFAISKETRKIADEDLPKDVKCPIVIGLMKAVVQMSLGCGITNCLAVMEPSLLKLLSRFDIFFAPVGPLVEYHGLRQPCHARVDSFLEGLRRQNSELWQFLTEPSIPGDAEKTCRANGCADWRGR
jgi:N-acyl amino acid synthase of PEP-CTERM/exosortase system